MDEVVDGGRGHDRNRHGLRLGLWLGLEPALAAHGRRSGFGLHGLRRGLSSGSGDALLLAIRRIEVPEGVVLETLPRLGDRVLLLVQEALDPEDEIDVLAAVDALAIPVLLAREPGKLALPEPQHVQLGVGVLADL